MHNSYRRDEYQIASQLRYQAVGSLWLSDFGQFATEGEEPEVGQMALVLMARGIFDGWKQPLGFFFANTATRSNVLHDLLARAISTCEAIGLCSSCGQRFGF